jgi:O-antigen/teichoic acid export membrane protein
MANSVLAAAVKWMPRHEVVRGLKASTFARDVSITFVTKVAVVLIGFASSIITARYLGPEGRGILVVLMTIAGIASHFGNFGLHASNTYFVAQDRKRLHRIVGNSFWLSLVGGSVIGCIAFGVLYSNQGLITGIPLPLLIVALLSVPFTLLFMLEQNILLGIQKIKDYNLFEFAKQLMTFLVVAALLILLGQGVSAAIATTTFFAIVFGLFLMKDLQSGGGTYFGFDLALFRQMLRYGLKAYLAALFAFLVIRFDMLMVNYFLSAREAGVYSVTVQIVDLLYMLPVVIGMILFPKVSGMKEGSWEFTRKVAWVTTGLMFVICFIAALLARPFIVFLYGDAFGGAVGALHWLLPGIFALSVQTVFMNYFVGIGLPVYAVCYHLIGFVLNFALNLMLIPMYSINGAAIASTAAYLIICLISFYFFHRGGPSARNHY